MRFFFLISTIALFNTVYIFSHDTYCSTIIITNTTDKVINVAGNILKSGQSTKLKQNKFNGSFLIKDGKKKYLIQYGQPISGTVDQTSRLDFATIVWLAHDGQLYNQGIDQIEIENDTMYTIAVRYYLSHVKSTIPITHKIIPQTINSKIVRDETGSHPDGIAEIIDGNNKKYRINIPRRKSPNADWKTIKLCASTIALFNENFSVTVN